MLLILLYIMPFYRLIFSIKQPFSCNTDFKYKKMCYIYQLNNIKCNSVTEKYTNEEQK